MEKVAIFGAAGPIGRYVGMELDRRGIPFRAVGRTAGKLEEAFGKLPHAEVVAADLSDAGGATQAARGVDTIIYTLGVTYTEFPLYPKIDARGGGRGGGRRSAAVPGGDGRL